MEVSMDSASCSCSSTLYNMKQYAGTSTGTKQHCVLYYIYIYIYIYSTGFWTVHCSVHTGTCMYFMYYIIRTSKYCTSNISRLAFTVNKTVNCKRSANPIWTCRRMNAQNAECLFYCGRFHHVFCACWPLHLLIAWMTRYLRAHLCKPQRQTHIESTMESAATDKQHSVHSSYHPFPSS